MTSVTERLTVVEVQAAARALRGRAAYTACTPAAGARFALERYALPAC